MKNLVIVSDMNGKFLSASADDDLLLGKHFDVVERFDSRAIGEVKDSSRKHDEFIASGIDVAASTLIKKYSSGVDTAVGLSIGGTILWRAALRGLQVRKLICFSSTRLRFENETPSSDLRLFFGTSDPNRPEVGWATGLGVTINFVKDQHHDFYRNEVGLRLLHEAIKS